MAERTVRPKDLEQCEILWTFNAVREPIADPQVILVLGSNDISVAHFAAGLAFKYAGATLVFSGGVAHTDDLLKTTWSASEADTFAEVALGMGVPAARVMREPRAKNTQENILFSRELLRAAGREPSRVLLTQKPFMCLRALLTARHNWPQALFGIEHETISFTDYYRRIARQELIDIIVGDTDRIVTYPSRGYFAPAAIPPDVTRAMEYLVARGFTGHILR